MPSENVWGIKPQTFFKKTIDKVANSWYNNYRKKKREVMKMTNEEKFQKGIVIYKTEDDVVCELWGASTKHADVIYSMNRDIENKLFHRCQFADNSDHDIFQWLLYIASIQTWKNTAREIVEIALAEWY